MSRWLGCKEEAFGGPATRQAPAFPDLHQVADVVIHRRLGLDVGLTLVGLHLAKDRAVLVDEEAAALVDGVALNRAAVDDLGAAVEDEVAADLPEDVDATAELDDQVA